TVNIASARFPVIGARELKVRVQRSMPPTLKMRDTAVGMLLQTALSLEFVPGSTPQQSYQIRLTSEDPSRVALSARASETGSGSVTISYPTPSGNSPRVWVQGRASSGIVRLKAEVDGGDPVYANIALASPIVALAGPPQTLNIGLGDVVRDLSITTA